MDRLDKLALWHQISSARYLGPVRFRNLWRHLGSDLSRVFKMTDKELREIKEVGTPQAIKGIRDQADNQSRSRAFMEDQMRRATASGGEILTLDDARYPRFLAASKMCHAIIYCIGKIDAFTNYQKAISVVGSREAAAQSCDLAKSVAGNLARDGWVIVSGMAKGIDSAAHEGALAVGGKTIAVLGCGPDILYPPEAKELYGRIKVNGLVLSEFPFGERIDAIRLKKRNKTTVAMSLAVFLVESDTKGGAMNALKASKEQNKPAFTILPDWPAKKSGNEQASKSGAAVLPVGPALVTALLSRLGELAQPVAPPPSMNA